MQETEEGGGKAFGIAAWRQGVQLEIRKLSEDPFSALKEAGTKSLLQYLVIASLKPVAEACAGDGNQAAHALQTVEKVAGSSAQPVLDYFKDVACTDGDPAELAASLEGRLNSSPEFCRAVEEILLQTNTPSLVQNIFAAEEWLLRSLRNELRQWHGRDLFRRVVFTIASEQYEAAPVTRGSLNLEVGPSKPTVVAGEEFSLFVVIRNPYQVPAVVYTAETHIPIELLDMIYERNQRKELESERQARLDELGLKGWRRSVRDAWERWREQRRLRDEPGARIAEAVGPEYKPELVEPTPAISVGANIEVGSIAEGGRVTGVEIKEVRRLAQFALDFPEQPTPEYLDRIMWRIEAYKSGKIPVLLQPGDSTVKQFVFRTRRWLLFTPLAHSFQIQVRYLVDGQDHLETVKHDLSIQATIKATMIGAILGATLGGIARILVDNASQPLASLPAQIGSLALAVILSAVTVVSLARKSNVQQIISVEDFWGGLFLGFLIGYLGQNFALELLSPSAAA